MVYLTEGVSAAALPGDRDFIADPAIGLRQDQRSMSLIAPRGRIVENSGTLIVASSLHLRAPVSSAR